MSSSILWYLAMQWFALAAVPLLFSVCNRLPDRGYGLSKGMGLLLITWFTWLAAHVASAFPAFGFSFGTVAGAWFVLLVASLVCLLRSGRDLTTFLRSRWRVILHTELIFLTAFILMIALRAYVPHISYHIADPEPNGFVDHAAEKFTDFAILNGLLTSSAFPPHDAWLSGFTLNYYYFGHMLWAVLIKFTSIRPEIGFNLALAGLLAIASSLAFSLGLNATARKRWGWFSMFLIVFASNLDGFWQFLGIVKTALVDANDGRYWLFASPWWRNYDFWRSSRAVENTITEFPAFSFILGDLHAHLSALPIMLCGLILAVQVFRNARHYVSVWRYELHNIDELALCAVVAGALSAANSWDVVTYAAVLTLALWAGSTGRLNPYAWNPGSRAMGRRAARLIASTFVAAVTILLGVLLLFLPFIWNFRPPDPQEGWLIKLLSPDLRTSPFELGTHWFLHAWAPVVFVAGLIFCSRRPAADPARRWAVIMVVAAAAAVLRPIWGGWVAVGAFAGAVGAVALMLTRRLSPQACLVTGIVALFCVQIWFCELFYFDDIFSGDIERINTVFKIYYSLWPVITLAAILALRLMVRGAQWSRRRVAWVIGGTLLAGGIYPILGPVSRVSSSTVLGHFDPPEGLEKMPPPKAMLAPDAKAKSLDEALDGFRYLRYLHPDDLAAVLWMRTKTPPDARLLEAPGNQYTYAGRFGTLTGRPSFAGWLSHEWGWRGRAFGDQQNPNNERARRDQLAADVYHTTSPETIRQLLKPDKIRYVIIGDEERRNYPLLDELPFEQAAAVAYEKGGTRVYDLQTTAAQ